MTDLKKSTKLSFARLTNSSKIRKDWVFKHVFENGKFTKGAIFNLWIYLDKDEKAASSGPSLGVIVGRKVHLRANVRNLWKRRMREVFLKNKARIKPQALVLLQARQQKEVPAFAEMITEFEKLMTKIGGMK